MTEAEWLTSTDWPALLLALPQPPIASAAGRRKLRLFACACLYSCDQELTVPVAICERVADGKQTPEDERALMNDPYTRAVYHNTDPAVVVNTTHGMRKEPLWAAYLRDVFENPWRSPRLAAVRRRNNKPLPMGSCAMAVMQANAQDVKDEERWQTKTVVDLAFDAYLAKAFDRLPIIADAAEEAGCTDTVVLAHLRDPGPHVRGCWALDLLLDPDGDEDAAYRCVLPSDFVRGPLNGLATRAWPLTTRALFRRCNDVDEELGVIATPSAVRSIVKPLTENMLRVLRWLAAGLPAGHNCRTQSEHGGRHTTLFALLRRGLIDTEYRITAAGRALLIEDRP